MGALLERLRALTGNRWAMAGLAGAAGLGAVALARSRGAGSTLPSPGVPGVTEGASAADGPAFTGQSFPNTYATDLAAAAGDMIGKYADEVAEFTAAQQANATSLAALSKATAKQQTSIDAVTKKVASLKPAPKATTKPKKTTGKVAATTKTPSGWKTITIRSGDTLGAIARRYDTSVAALSQRNKITNPNRISAGAKLLVPA